MSALTSGAEHDDNDDGLYDLGGDDESDREAIDIVKFAKNKTENSSKPKAVTSSSSMTSSRVSDTRKAFTMLMKKVR